ncbi:type IV pilin N-terminal domain-containing protein [Methanolobus sp. ZRKC2]|uniref:type IV pilin N-terminal domain-containing protein n=1 Tax=Methanolobus sp. ZRKC2 TaxID=3125783 RepID=UPI0032569843
MKLQNMFLNNNKAASPVIGVMLMVVVTVILAAAVSSYSGSIGGSTKTAPSAVFEVQIKKGVDIGGDNMSFMKIKEVTGDSIDTKDLKIITTCINSDNNFSVTEVYPNQENTDRINGGSPTINSVSPYWNNPAKGVFGTHEAVNFGNYVLKPGVVMVAESNENDVPKSDRTGMEAMISDWKNVTSGDFITVTFVHIPSGKPIFNSEVEVM